MRAFSGDKVDLAKLLLSFAPAQLLLFLFLTAKFDDLKNVEDEGLVTRIAGQISNEWAVVIAENKYIKELFSARCEE